MKRDYTACPLVKYKTGDGHWKLERPCREDLYEKYIVENSDVSELALFFNVSAKMVGRWLKEYSIKKDKQKQILCLQRIRNNILYERPTFLPDTKEYDVYRKYGIDITKLTRDYIKFPLLKNQRYDEKDLKYLYIELNLNISAVAEILGKKSKVISDLHFYKIEKPKNIIRQNIKNTCIEKYGGNAPSCSNIVRQKQENTNIVRYGTKNISSTEYFRNAYKKAMNEKYNVDNYFQIYDCSGRKSNSNKHISDSQYAIMSDENLFADLVYASSSAEEVARIIGITKDYVYVLCKKYNIIPEFKHRYSAYELEIRDIIKEPCVYNTKIYGKELDIYIPSKKIGIEFNGDYWHGELNKPKSWHFDKSLYFLEKGIFVYNIWEWEWTTKKNQIINQLYNLLGYNTHKIFARKCIIKEVPTKIKSKFLCENHIQGKDRSSYNLGLYYNDELVSVMTFVKPKFNKHYKWELSRFCSKAGYNIAGGASKLFKYFINKKQPESIISYSDIAHTKGNLYALLGFKFDDYVRPNYIWKLGRKIILKSSCRRKHLDTVFSESDYMHSIGAYKVYNCGLKRWVYQCVLKY